MSPDQFCHWLKGLADSTETEGYCHPMPDQWDLIRKNLDAALGVESIDSEGVGVCGCCDCDIRIGEGGGLVVPTFGEIFAAFMEDLHQSIANVFAIPSRFLEPKQFIEFVVPVSYLEIDLKAAEEALERIRRGNIEICDRHYGPNRWIWPLLNDSEVADLARAVLSIAEDEAREEHRIRERGKKIDRCVSFYLRPRSFFDAMTDIQLSPWHSGARLVSAS